MSEKTEKKNCLTDQSGKQSAIRIMSFIALAVSAYFGYLTIKQESDVGVYITTTFAVAAFAPKVIQKWAEDYQKNKPE